MRYVFKIFQFSIDFIDPVHLDTDKYSWSENYAGSSGLQSPLPGHKLPSLPVPVNVDQLEMDRIDQGVLVYCPLLDNPGAYVADVVDLSQDTEARYKILLSTLKLILKKSSS